MELGSGLQDVNNSEEMTAESTQGLNKLQNNPRFSNLLNQETPVIAEVSEAEENAMTQHKIGGPFTSARTNEKTSDRNSAVQPKFTEEQLRDRNRDSMFGTMLLSDHTQHNNMSKEQDKRMK